MFLIELKKKNMELNEWLTILGALGGFEAIKWTVNFYVHRHTNARKEDAAADAVEIQNLLTIIDSLNKQIERLEKDLVGRNSKVDFLYAELRKSEEKILEKLSELHVVELQLKEAELSRCDLWECLKRIPPKFKNRTEEVQQ